MSSVHDADFDPEEEVVDGELIRTDERPGQALDWVRAPAVQNAVAAATGFVAGAATLALARRYGKARLERALAAASSEPALAAGAQRGPGRTYIVHVRPLPAIGPGTSVE